ncbi:MAG: DUF424 family protein [Nanoarchaeota archaeon]
MFIKIHRSYRTVVALADSELVGKKFEEGKYQLDVTENFYKGDKVTEEQAIQIIKRQVIEDATFNIVGQKAIQAAEKAGIIQKEETSSLQGIPFTLILI